MDPNVLPRRVNDYVIPGSLPRRLLQLHWNDVTTKDLKDTNITKELADEWVERGRAIMARKIQLQRG